jgi:hypothetical protein
MNFQPRESTNGILYAYGRSSMYIDPISLEEEPTTIINMANRKSLGCDGISEPHGVVSARSRQTAESTWMPARPGTRW